MIDVYQVDLPRNLISLHLAETPSCLLLGLSRQELLFCHPTAFASMTTPLVCCRSKLPVSLKRRRTNLMVNLMLLLPGSR